MISYLPNACTFSAALLSILRRHLSLLLRLHTTKSVMQPKQGRQDISSCLWKPTSILRPFRLWHTICLKKQKDLGLEVAMYLCCSELFWYVWLVHFPQELKFKFYICNIITSFAVTVLVILTEMFCSFLCGFSYCFVTDI